MGLVAFFYNRSLKTRWFVYVIVAALYVGSWLIGKYGSPRNRFFVERDPTLSYPWVTNTIPGWTLIFFAFVIPAFVVLVTLLIIHFSENNQFINRRSRDLHLTLIVLIEVIAVTNLITNLLKVLVGRLRPDFYAFCDYKGYRTSFDTGNFTDYYANTFPGAIGDFQYCNLKGETDAHYSFPSGHTSLTFCGMTFIVMFLMNITSQIRFPASVHRNVLRFFIVLIPFSTGALVATSRIIDYKHNVEDTAWGALIGIACCALCYHSNFLSKRPKIWGDKKEDKEGPNFVPLSSPSNADVSASAPV